MRLLRSTATAPLFHHDHADDDSDQDEDGGDADEDAPGHAGVATRLVQLSVGCTVGQLVLNVTRVHVSKSLSFD